MFLFVILFNLLLLSSSPILVQATNIGAFNDGTCSKSSRNMNGPNGYPDGTCTPLHIATGQSFQVVTLDPGCQVTIYGNDSDASHPCSSDTKIVAQLAECYNSSWIYYSIDGCDIPSTIPSSSSSTPAPTLLSPTVTTSATSNAAHTATHTGIVVGGIVGGVSVVAIILFVALYLLRRRFYKSSPPPPMPPSYELSEERALRELGQREKTVHTELYSHEPAAEIGRNSIFMLPVELPGDAVDGGDKKSINPLIMVHRV